MIHQTLRDYGRVWGRSEILSLAKERMALVDRCVNNFSERMFYFFMLAAGATVMFVVLTQQVVDDLLAEVIEDPGYRYMTIVIIFFITVYLLDRLIEGWRLQNHICV